MAGPALLSKPQARPLFALRKDARPPPRYSLLLHRDKFQDDRYVSKVIAGVIEGMTMEEATAKTEEARDKGVALLRVYPQEVAEERCELIRRNGVKSTVQPH